MKEIRSLRELSITLNVDQRLRKLCLIKDGEKDYPRSVLSRFTKLVGAEQLRRIIDEKVIMLLRRNNVQEVDAVLDASSIKAWSIRHPRNNLRGFSDSDTMVGRHGRGFDRGYKLHISVDHRSILPLASVLAPANDNEKRHGLTLVEKTKRVLRRAGARLGIIIGDSQYSSGRMRGLVDEAVIPFMSNQRRGEAVLRVDRKFRTHGPEEERAKYHMRPAVEAAYAFLKTPCGVKVNKVRRLGRVAVYALYSVLCHVLTREAAEDMGRPDKAVSPTFFNT